MAGLDRGFAAHIAQGVTTLCHCWQVTRADGAVFAFTAVSYTHLTLPTKA